MTKAAIYTRSNPDDHDRQREELLGKLGDTHEIVGEYQDSASGNLGIEARPGLKRLLDDTAQDKFDVLLCTGFPASVVGDYEGDCTLTAQVQISYKPGSTSRR